VTITHLKSMFREIDSIRQEEELRDNSKYEHPLFQTIQDILSSIDDVSFKQASTRIGRSLVSEFSELDSSESGMSGDDALTVSTQDVSSSQGAKK
jgi:hypothetical protein